MSVDGGPNLAVNVSLATGADFAKLPRSMIIQHELLHFSYVGLPWIVKSLTPSSTINLFK